MRLVIDFKHILHGGDKRGAAVWWDHPLLLQVRLENVFFSVRPIVLSLTRSTISSSTTLASSSLSDQRECPLGGSEQARAISLASAAPSKIDFLAELGECFRFSAASSPSSTSLCRVRATVSTLVSSAAAISLSLQHAPASDASAFNRMRAFSTCRAARFPVPIKVPSRSRSSSLSVTTYFFTAACLAVTNHLRHYRNSRIRNSPQNHGRGALDYGQCVLRPVEAGGRQSSTIL